MPVPAVPSPSGFHSPGGLTATQNRYRGDIVPGMRKNHIPKQRIVIEVSLTDHDQLKAIADYYGASVRGTILRYIRAGLTTDEKSILGGTPNVSK